MKICIKINGGFIERDYSEAVVVKAMSNLLSKRTVVCNGCALQGSCRRDHIIDDNIEKGIYVEDMGDYPFECSAFQGPTIRMEQEKYAVPSAAIVDPTVNSYVRSLR